MTSASRVLYGVLLSLIKSRGNRLFVVLASLVPRHKLRHAKRACSDNLWYSPTARDNSRNSVVCGTHCVRSTAQTSTRKACSFLYPFQRLRKRKLNQLWYFAYGSYQFKKLGSFGTSPNGSFHGTNFGTQSVLVFISVSTFAQAQVERI